MKPSRSFFSPSSNGKSIAAPTASAAANGASSPRAFLVSACTALVKIERSAFAAASLLSSSRNLRNSPCKGRRLRRLAAFGDVGAGDEGAAGAGEHDRLHFRIGGGAFDGFEDAATNCRAQGVHRRAIHGDNGDHVLTFELDHFTHST